MCVCTRVHTQSALKAEARHGVHANLRVFVREKKFRTCTTACQSALSTLTDCDSMSTVCDKHTRRGGAARERARTRVGKDMRVRVCVHARAQ